MATVGLHFDPIRVRPDFPILASQVAGGHPLVYLDNAATAQKPVAVLTALDRFYRCCNANVHRGVHYLSTQATDAYDQARARVASFINANKPQEVVFIRNATEAFNLVAQTWGRQYWTAGDEIILSIMEHHSNIVPWQLLAEQIGCVVKVVPIMTTGELDMEAFYRAFSDKTRFVAITHASNALGTIPPVKEIIAFAHQQGAYVMLDGAQAVAHFAVDVQDLDCDFYAFTGHKLFAPTGIGVLYGKQPLLDTMPPYQGGGSMINTVSFAGTTFRKAPERFEAGTPNIAGAIALAAAIDYLQSLDGAALCAYEHALLDYATQRLQEVPGLQIHGQAAAKVSLISFTIAGIHPHDIGTVLDNQGIAIRAGHHCAMPLMKVLQVPATARASFAFYNTFAEVDQLVQALQAMHKLFH